MLVTMDMVHLQFLDLNMKSNKTIMKTNLINKIKTNNNETKNIENNSLIRQATKIITDKFK